MRARYLKNILKDDLKKKMVFIGGPRQVGKTTLARMMAESKAHVYLNWDNPKHKIQITAQQWQPNTQYLVFDEIHKYDKWKNLIKGIWDTRINKERIIVTGSSKLNIYKASGDSLLGRYHYHALHPFSLKEMSGSYPNVELPEELYSLVFPEKGEDIKTLFKFGGFPEPLLEGNERTLLRWQNERFERIFREDIRDAEKVRYLSQVELLGALIPGRVASPLSLASVAEDIQTSPKTIINWMELLCRNYYCFRVMPFHSRLERALKKESKYYLWDWSQVEHDGPRFENLIASHLLKFCDFHYYANGLKIELRYLRDRERREVDFLVTWNNEPWFMVECKLKPGPHKPLSYFGDRLNVRQRYMVTLDDQQHYMDKKNEVHVIPASKFLMAFV